MIKKLQTLIAQVEKEMEKTLMALIVLGFLCRSRFDNQKKKKKTRKKTAIELKKRHNMEITKFIFNS